MNIKLLLLGRSKRLAFGKAAFSFQQMKKLVAGPTVLKPATANVTD
jgi:hypothetical protein